MSEPIHILMGQRMRRNVRSMKRLLRAIWHLGPRLGYHYWKIESRCIKNPELVKRWAHACRCEAKRIFTDSNDGEDPKYFLLMSWADELEKSYADYTKQNP